MQQLVQPIPILNASTTIKDTQDICKNMGDLICSGACLLGKRMGGGQGTRATPPRRLLRRFPALQSPPPGWLPRTPAASLPLAHLLHECTR